MGPGKYLQQILDEPFTSGYFSPNNTSLLDWVMAPKE